MKKTTFRVIPPRLLVPLPPFSIVYIDLKAVFCLNHFALIFQSVNDQRRLKFQTGCSNRADIETFRPTVFKINPHRFFYKIPEFNDTVTRGGIFMATFFMFGKYNSEAIKNISIERTQQAIDEIKKLGGNVMAMHVLLGKYDLLFCVSLPGIDEAIKASVTLSKLTGISFTTCPAITVEAFDQVITGKKPAPKRGRKSKA
jgi:uncharacterized protein with GYD domain